MSDKLYQKYFLSQSISILVFYASLFIVSVVLLSIKIPISSFHFYIGCIVWLASTFLLSKQLNIPNKVFYLSTSISLIILFLAGIYFSKIYDVYYDSQWYHMEAVIQMHNGWNPFYSQLINSQVSAGGANYLNHFPLAAWIVESDLFAFSNNLESAKCLTSFLQFGLFFSAAYLFNSILKINILAATFLAILTSVNPVTVLSSYSFYLDGQAAVFFSMACIFSLSFFVRRDTIFLFLALLSCLLLAHIKLTGSVYVCLIIAAIFVVNYFIKVMSLKQLFLSCTLWFVLTFIVIGFHPFVTNTIEKKSPIYPAVELAQKVYEIIPANFIGENRFEKLWLSVWAIPDWSRQPENAKIKNLLDTPSLWHYGDGVPETGGWGPLIVESMILMFVLLLFIFFTDYKSEQFRYGFIFIAFILATVFINPEPWCTRYIPQFWLAIIALLYIISTSKHFSFYSIHFSILLLLNVFVMGKVYVDEATMRSENMKKQFAVLLPIQDKIEIDFGWFKSFRYRMHEAGFDTTKFVQIPKRDSTDIPIEWGVKACYRFKTK